MERLDIVRAPIAIAKFIGSRLVGGAFGTEADKMNVQPRPQAHIDYLKTGE